MCHVGKWRRQLEAIRQWRKCQKWLWPSAGRGSIYNFFLSKCVSFRRGIPIVSYSGSRGLGSSTGRVFLGRTHNSAVPLSILESKGMRAIVREVG